MNNNSKKFNQKEYINNYKKEHKRQFKADLKIDEKEELDELLEKANLTKIQFIRNAKKELEKRVNQIND